MDFDTKASNIILIIFQMKVTFQHIYVCFNKKFVQLFFMKSHKSNFSIVIEMVKLIHIQYITKYFIKFCNYLNHFKSIFAFCSILWEHLFFQIYIFNYLILINNLISFENYIIWQIELFYFEIVYENLF